MRLLIFVALRQLWARKGLNGIAVCGVALGVLVLVVMTAIMSGFQQEFKDSILRAADHVIVHDSRKNESKSLLASLVSGPIVAQVSHEAPSDRPSRIARPDDTLRMIRSLPEVEAACGELLGQGVVSLGQRSNAASIRGIEPGEQQRCTPLASFVKQGSWTTFELGRDGILIGSLFAEKLGAKLGDRVNVVAPYGAAMMLEVIGIFEVGLASIDRGWVFVQLATAQRILGQPNAISEIGVRAVQPFEAHQLAARLEELTGYESESWQELNAGTLSVFGLQNIVVGFQIAAILTVGGFGILAVQIMIVLQKTRDIAILRSVGFCRSDILFVFLLQGVVVAIAGALLGDLLGWRLIAFLDSIYDPNAGYSAEAQLRVVDDHIAYAWAAAFALLVGTLASLLPAWRGARVEPVDVLRGQLG